MAITARTEAEVKELGRVISAEQYYEQNGLPLGTTWIVTKILWMRKHEPDLLAKTARFVQNFMDGQSTIQGGLKAFVDAVKAGDYPREEHSYT